MAITRRKISSTGVILLVDADVLARIAIADYLRACGHYVIETASTAEAMTVLRKGPRIGMILADTNVSAAEHDTAAFELASWVNRNRPDVKIILVNSLASKSETLREICAGPDGPAEGPFDLKQRIRAMRAPRQTSAPSSRKTKEG